MTEQATAEATRAAAWDAHCRAPKFRHITRELDGVLERESYVYSTPEGAIELWRGSAAPELSWNGSGYFGAVEVHSPKPLRKGQEPSTGHCEHAWGGQCWTTGSSMAFDQFENAFSLPDYIKGALAARHSDQFDVAEEED